MLPAAGTPVIAPVALLILKPLGKVGETVNVIPTPAVIFGAPEVKACCSLPT
jgi:hypothetical protein